MNEITLLPEQQRVADTVTGLCGVRAAAGSGKTTTLVFRAKRLATAGQRVLVLVFNREAAEDVRRRVRGTTIDVLTFHAFCYRMLQRFYPNEPMLRPNRIVGTPKGIQTSKLVFRAMAKVKAHKVDWRQVHEAYGIVREVRAAKPETPLPPLIARALQHKGDLPADELRLWMSLLDAYEMEKKQVGGIDFCDMAAYFLDATRQHDPGAMHQAGLPVYDAVCLDEAQDANPARWAVFLYLAQLATARGGSGLAVGDKRQSIYYFVGAEPELFDEYLNREDVQTLDIPVNLRSTQRIVDLGNSVVSGRGHVPARALDTAGIGLPPVMLPAGDIEKEARLIADRILEVAPNGCSTAQVAILARTNSYLAQLACALSRCSIGVSWLSGQHGPWNTIAGKHLLAYMRIHETKQVDYTALDVMNRPNRYAKRADLVALLRDAPAGILSIEEALARAPLKNKGVRKFLTYMQSFVALPWDKAVKKATTWLKEHAKKSAHIKTIATEDTITLYEALSKELITAGSTTAAVQVVTMGSDSPHQVVLSTIHGAKGLEWPMVHVAGLTKGVLPHREALDEEEEVRLLYVAVTRAIHLVSLSWANKPGPFVEIVDEYIKEITP